MNDRKFTGLLLLSMVILLSLFMVVTVTKIPKCLSLNSAASNKQLQSLYDFYTIDGIVTYPNYYAGAYLNDEGKLVVLVTTTSNDIRSALKSATKNDDLIIDASATFSYNYLSDISNYIGDYYDLHIKEGDDGVWSNLNYVGIDEVNNLVEISLKDLSLVNEFINGIGLLEAFSSSGDTGASNLPIVFVTGSLLTD